MELERHAKDLGRPPLCLEAYRIPPPSHSGHTLLLRLLTGASNRHTRLPDSGTGNQSLGDSSQVSDVEIPCREAANDDGQREQSGRQMCRLAMYVERIRLSIFDAYPGEGVFIHGNYFRSSLIRSSETRQKKEAEVD